MRLAIAAVLSVMLIACGPTGQVQVERHIECNMERTDCKEVTTQEKKNNGWDVFWNILFLMALAAG